ncbi:hypothetical protein ACIOC2_31425 [Streptomyces sp. NPDC088337]|uniref:hypothetical protein n=1 Tax=unclassified Streptomyces TaxID=2593676 RepID=UPI00382CD57D
MDGDGDVHGLHHRRRRCQPVHPDSDVEYWSGPATSTNGSGTFTPGQPTAAAAVALSSAQTAFAHTAGGGANSASWDPTVIVNVPSTVASGAYTGTITHSVA